MNFWDPKQGGKLLDHPSGHWLLIKYPVVVHGPLFLLKCVTLLSWQGLLEHSALPVWKFLKNHCLSSAFKTEVVNAFRLYLITFSSVFKNFNSVPPSNWSDVSCSFTTCSVNFYWWGLSSEKGCVLDRIIVCETRGGVGELRSHRTKKLHKNVELFTK